ncbi:dehydrase and lipid transport-domain-containing protein, partial [Bombardia bombarda]
RTTPLCARWNHKALSSPATATAPFTSPSTRRTYSSSNNNNNNNNASWLLSALPNLAGPSSPQTIHARRTLPYPPAHVYNLIANIDSYSAFLPHCTLSRVTAWTNPSPSSSPREGNDGASTTTRWPARADLTVGWGPFTESYTSRVYCVPGELVEAVSGAAQTTIPASTLARFGYDVSTLSPSSLLPSQKSGEAAAAPGIFESLVTRWTVRPVAATSSSGTAADVAGGWAEVTLSVRFQFVNAMLGHAVGQIASDKADEMVQAFEDRARALHGK